MMFVGIAELNQTEKLQQNKSIEKYSKTSMTRTPMTRLTWMIRTRFFFFFFFFFFLSPYAILPIAHEHKDLWKVSYFVQELYVVYIH